MPNDLMIPQHNEHNPKVPYHKEDRIFVGDLELEQEEAVELGLSLLDLASRLTPNEHESDLTMPNEPRLHRGIPNDLKGAPNEESLTNKGRVGGTPKEHEGVKS